MLREASLDLAVEEGEDTLETAVEAISKAASLPDMGEEKTRDLIKGALVAWATRPNDPLRDLRLG